MVLGIGREGWEAQQYCRVHEWCPGKFKLALRASGLHPREIMSGPPRLTRLRCTKVRAHGKDIGSQG